MRTVAVVPAYNEAETVGSVARRSRGPRPRETAADGGTSPEEDLVDD